MNNATQTIILSHDEFLDLLPDLSVQEGELLGRSYDFAKDAHDGQKRSSGEDYFVHCVEVARILIELGLLDIAMIAAGLLHDVVEDTPFTVADIEEKFGQQIAGLVEGLTKIERLEIKKRLTAEGKPRDREAENLRKTLLSMTGDVRVILIKLSDRLHNMRTLWHLSSQRQVRIARETMDIYAPLANRLGIWQMKWELEDLSFRYLEPDPYKLMAGLIAERRADRDKYVQKIVQKMEELLKEQAIEGEVSGRPKHIYSIWRKMERKGVSFEEIFDARAIRVLVPDTITCYQVLGVIHQTWRPIAGEFDDYIASPKGTFYQSLHTAVILEDGKTMEVQIRTPEMHLNAEYGIAAHWRYKEPNKKRDEAFDRRLAYLREMIESGRSTDDAEEFVDVVRDELFQERVYVFTPRGDIIDLPNGATPIDFAYHIHTDVGDRCRGAKVNGKLVPLDYVLAVGDRVEILASRRGGPSRDWLNPNLKYVKTKRAQTKIRQWFRKQDRENMIALGREIVERELKRLSVEKTMSHEEIAALFKVDGVESFLAKIGFGEIHPQHITTKILEHERENSNTYDFPVSTPSTATRVSPEGIRVQGARGLLSNLARCCNPVMGDEIMGYITRGRGITVHRADCQNILNVSDRERLIAVDWGQKAEERYPVSIIISAYDREGLIRDIGTTMAEEKINMRDVSSKVNNHIATLFVTMDVESAEQLSRVLTRIEDLPNVMEVRRKIG